MRSFVSLPPLVVTPPFQAASFRLPSNEVPQPGSSSHAPCCEVLSPKWVNTNYTLCITLFSGKCSTLNSGIHSSVMEIFNALPWPCVSCYIWYKHIQTNDLSIAMNRIYQISPSNYPFILWAMPNSYVAFSDDLPGKSSKANKNRQSCRWNSATFTPSSPSQRGPRYATNSW